MADVTQTAANVRAGSNTQTALKQAGAALVGGDVVYADSTESNKVKAANTSSAAEAAAIGICLMNVADDGYVVVATSGKVNVGATLVKGTVYGVSDNSGKIRPVSDNATNDYVTKLGTAISTTELDLSIEVSGIQHA